MILSGHGDLPASTIILRRCARTSGPSLITTLARFNLRTFVLRDPLALSRIRRTRCSTTRAFSRPSCARSTVALRAISEVHVAANIGHGATAIIVLLPMASRSFEPRQCRQSSAMQCSVLLPSSHMECVVEFAPTTSSGQCAWTRQRG